MNYIYDIFVNLQKDDYDFYDWNKDDKLTHIRKIPLFKISSELLKQIINYDFTINEDFIKRIANRTEIFSNKSIKLVKYMCLFSDGLEIVAIKFNNNGKKDKISRLMLDEKEDTLDVTRDIEEINIKLELIKQNKNYAFMTRKEKEMYNYIQKELQIKNYEKLKYTYFECFNTYEDDYNKIIKSLKNIIDNKWNIYHKKIFEILKLSSIYKSKN